MFLPRATIHRQSRFLNSLLCILLLACSLAKAQEPDEVVRVRTDLITVPATVLDSKHRRVFGLGRDDFSLRVDGKPAELSHFSVGTSRVALLFLLDASGSAREIIGQQREAALALFARFGPGSRVAVLQFGNFVRLSVPFTTDTAALQDSFTFGVQPGAGTAIFDSAAAAVRSFDGSGGFSAERRIVVLISDGLDTLSSTSYQTVIDTARLRGVSFYVLHFPLYSPRDGRLAPRPTSKGFRDLADQTGGHYFRIGDARSALDPHAHYDLAPVFQAIEDDLRAQYVLGFYPNDATRDGQTHSVTVNLTNQKRKLKVNQLRTSYNLNTKQ
jgi:Ca-activated chloride channel family protein